MPNPFKNSVRILQHLSIDVVIGSVGMGVLAAQLLNTEVPLIWWFILPLCVWVMYTLDHLLDAANSKKEPTIPRHLFHRQHAHQLIYLVGGLGITALSLTLLFLPIQIILGGVILTTSIFVYFLSLRLLPERFRKWIPKEMVIACIYVGGIFFVPWWFSIGSPAAKTHWIMVIILLLVWSEGVMAAWFDRENDLLDGHHSFATLAGKSLTKKIVTVVLSATFAGLILIIIRSQAIEIFSSSLVLLAINSGLLIIIWGDKYFEKNSRYRSWGELLFILPVILLLV